MASDDNQVNKVNDMIIIMMFGIIRTIIKPKMIIKHNSLILMEHQNSHKDQHKHHLEAYKMWNSESIMVRVVSLREGSLYQLSSFPPNIEIHRESFLTLQVKSIMHTKDNHISIAHNHKENLRNNNNPQINPRNDHNPQEN